MHGCPVIILGVHAMRVRYYTCTSAPSKPGAISSGCVVLQQLQEVEFVVVVLQVCLIKHHVPVSPIFTVHLGLEYTRVSKIIPPISKDMQGYLIVCHLSDFPRAHIVNWYATLKFSGHMTCT